MSDVRFVTVLFTELVASAGRFDGRDAEAGDAVRRAHFAMLRDALGRHGGREVKTTGDGLMVVFPSAVEAVRCAVAMQRGATDQPMRIGIDAGERAFGPTAIAHDKLLTLM